jgi:hypothetical protein
MKWKAPGAGGASKKFLLHYGCHIAFIWIPRPVRIILLSLRALDGNNVTRSAGGVISSPRIFMELHL